MKCAILVSEKLGGVPLTECGGVVLQPGDKLLVHPELAKKMKEHYGAPLIIAGEEEKAQLKCVSYEYIHGGAKAVASSAMKMNEAPSALAEVSSDKSMQGKYKARRKG